jgi:hypothetical protein
MVHVGSQGEATCFVDALGAQAVRRPGLLLGCRGEDILDKFSR